MGQQCCSTNPEQYERDVTNCSNIENGKYEELIREDINNEKFIIQLKFNELNNIKVLKPELKLDVIHLAFIGSILTASEQYIDKGNIMPFIYNTMIQTAGEGEGSKIWTGVIFGNLYTLTGIPLSLINEEFKDEQIILKIATISIIQNLNKLIKNEFFINNSNDIICKDKCRLGGIFGQKYKDFYMLGIGINIVDKPKQEEENTEEISPCCIKVHLKEDMDPPNPLNLSIEITKNILYNLNLTTVQIDILFTRYLIK